MRVGCQGKRLGSIGGATPLFVGDGSHCDVIDGLPSSGSTIVVQKLVTLGFGERNAILRENQSLGDTLHHFYIQSPTGPTVGAHPAIRVQTPGGGWTILGNDLLTAVTQLNRPCTGDDGEKGEQQEGEAEHDAGKTAKGTPAGPSWMAGESIHGPTLRLLCGYPPRMNATDNFRQHVGSLGKFFYLLPPPRRSGVFLEP